MENKVIGKDLPIMLEIEIVSLKIENMIWTNRDMKMSNNSIIKELEKMETLIEMLIREDAKELALDTLNKYKKKQ